MGTSIYFWIGFHIFILIMLALDLGVFHKNSHKVPVKEAIIWSCIWITLALLFDLFIFLDKNFGHIRALEFLTGYVIEYSLSVDNIFVFILIFHILLLTGSISINSILGNTRCSDNERNIYFYRGCSD